MTHSFLLCPSYIVRLLRFPRQGQYVNPSTEDVTKFALREENSKVGPGTAFLATDRFTNQAVIFVAVGGLMTNFLKDGANVGVDGKPPFARGISVLEHKMESEGVKGKHTCSMTRVCRSSHRFSFPGPNTLVCFSVAPYML